MKLIQSETISVSKFKVVQDIMSEEELMDAHEIMMEEDEEDEYSKYEASTSQKPQQIEVVSASQFDSETVSYQDLKDEVAHQPEETQTKNIPHSLDTTDDTDHAYKRY